MRRVWLLLALALALAAAAPGCSGDGSAPSGNVTRLPDPEDVPDSEIAEELMLALSRAKNFHLKADVYLRDGNVDAAIVEVGNILGIPFPPDAPESEDVLLDARARMAKLLVGRGKTGEALQVIDAGIAAARRESFFLANAYTVRGEVLDAMAAETADEARARELRAEAILQFDRSIEINTRLQRRLMEERRR